MRAILQYVDNISKLSKPASLQSCRSNFPCNKNLKCYSHSATAVFLTHRMATGVTFQWRSSDVPVMFSFFFFYRAQNPWKIAQDATCKARLVYCTLWTCTRRHTGSSGIATSPVPLNVRPPKPVDLSKTYCTRHFFLVFTWDFCYSVVLLICISGFSVMIFMFQRGVWRPTA